MTEFINGVEYLYTIPAEEPISYCCSWGVKAIAVTRRDEMRVPWRDTRLLSTKTIKKSSPSAVMLVDRK